MTDLIPPTPFRSPAQFVAFGFGSGLAPKAPGTFGTLAAVPHYLLLSQMIPVYYTLVVIATAALGIWICDIASKQLQVHDHAGIVWDEFVGYWITMWLLPPDWLWIVAGFVVFRVFDIAKPWPVGYLDRKVEGGLGIMLDDIMAGLMACLTLHIARWIVS